MTEISKRNAETLAEGFDRVYSQEIASHKTELEAGRQGRLRSVYAPTALPLHSALLIDGVHFPLQVGAAAAALAR